MILDSMQDRILSRAAQLTRQAEAEMTVLGKVDEEAPTKIQSPFVNAPASGQRQVNTTPAE